MRGCTVVLILALALTLFLLVPLAIVVPMSFSTAISFAFPPPGVWLGYYDEYFSSRSWMRPTVNSFIIGAGTMVVTMAILGLATTPSLG